MNIFAVETALATDRKVIVLVEDNPDDEVLTLRAFKRSRVKNSIVVLRDGGEALDWFFCRGAHIDRDSSIQPAVVLLDLKLPVVDGLEVLRILKEDTRTKFIPIVVLTSSQEEEDMLASYQLGCNSYVRKPVDFHQFVDAARQVELYWLVLNEPPPAL